MVGCEHATSAHRYSVLNGQVVDAHPETGELTVRVERRNLRDVEPESIECVVTKDSELYVNGRFAHFDATCVGDPVELVGYNDPNPRSGRFVVSFAYFSHEDGEPSPAIRDAPVED